MTDIRPKFFIIYRKKDSKKILRYSILRLDNGVALNDLITNYNSSNVREEMAQVAVSSDLIDLIEIAESHKRIKDYDIKSIQESLDRVQTEIYDLNESLK